jgi:hypothetical protein
MMNKTMMEDNLDGSSNFKFLEENTSKEDLLWVIQKGDTVTTSFINMSEDRDHPCAIGENHISTLRYALAYILFVSLS